MKKTVKETVLELFSANSTIINFLVAEQSNIIVWNLSSSCSKVSRNSCESHFRRRDFWRTTSANLLALQCYAQVNSIYTALYTAYIIPKLLFKLFILVLVMNLVIYIYQHSAKWHTNLCNIPTVLSWLHFEEQMLHSVVVDSITQGCGDPRKKNHTTSCTDS